MRLKRVRPSKYFKDKKLNICILGGGNVGTLLLGDIGSNKDLSVRLFTSNPHKWSHEIEVCSNDNTVKYKGKIDIISDNPEDVIGDADIIISTLPSQVFPKIIGKIKSFIKSRTWIGVMPGSGGSEFYCKELLEIGCILFGFQRVHGISRIKEYGKSVYDLGKKNELHIAAIPVDQTESICMKLENIMKIKCNPLPNYLNVTLTPSNSILHTTRLYTMFYHYKEGLFWDEVIDFYEEWNDEASKMLIACDEELQLLCKSISGLNLTGVKSLKEHYESGTPEEMTKKINNIIPFKGIKAPMIKTQRGYIPDFNSRYFLEDFPYGLCIIKGFCDVVGLDTPNIDKVLIWFEKIAEVEYYVNNKFEGKDLKYLSLPKNYGLSSVEDIIFYYS
ncbi:NAD/NADP octopine/nopaline dehydrogenase family protein [Clostridium sp. MSJ-11]|uniref:NAD/NADP octopine/nopaline dehydrogenase family protein n=1 Tax=Clostridium mobile TaxID=2841512 RepID=A0ABS6ECZ5_9CLOT|nr:NAD/NADP-dependent octopine/nopaline dehydrogenase family protein [Clostridium mobile]MBU5483064.1 NAD/NADP octopine/nopaline dehydrogenase family protein [Clostridium mobile]